jgi:alpha-galactosidase
MKPLDHKAKAVALFNRGPLAEPITIQLKDVGISGSVHGYDLWAHKDLGILKDSYTATVPRHGVVMVRLSR